MPNPKQDLFNLNHLVETIKIAALKDDAKTLIKFILEEAVSDPDWLLKGMPDFTEDEQILFEDDSISIWHTRYLPDQIFPPHDHQMTASIGLYKGSERNDFYKLNDAGKLKKDKELTLLPGDVFQIEPATIHAVACVSNEPCCGIHVYQGKLTDVDRSLFDPENNAIMKFTEENYNNLIR